MTGLDDLPPLNEVEAELCRRSFPHFIRAAWQHSEKDPFVDSWLVDALGEHLQALADRKIRRLLINIPPRCAKSTYCAVLWPAWVWLREPGFRLINASYAANLAVRDSLHARRLMNTAWFDSLNRDAVGAPIFRLRSNHDGLTRRLKDNEDFYENSRGGSRLALGVEGALTGRGGQCILVDDPQDPRRAYSDAERLAANTWWDRTVPTRLDDPTNGLKVVIQQRIHFQDLTGHILEQGGYEHLVIPMRFKPSARCVTSLGDRTWTDPRIEEGELLQPERFDEVALKEIETALGPYGVAAQLQQTPVPEGGGTFRQSWFKRWTMLPVFDQVAMSVDATFGDSTNADYVVMQVWGFRGPDAFFLDQIRARMDFVDTEQAFIDLHAKHKARGTAPSAICIERKANGEALIARLKTRFGGIVQDRDGRPGLMPRESKEARAMAVTPFVAAGNVYLPEDAPWVGDFLIEAVNFPRYEHDDQVDAMTQVLGWKFLSSVQVEADTAKNKLRAWAKLGI